MDACDKTVVFKQITDHESVKGHDGNWNIYICYVHIMLATIKPYQKIRRSGPPNHIALFELHYRSTLLIFKAASGRWHLAVAMAMAMSIIRNLLFITAHVVRLEQ